MTDSADTNLVAAALRGDAESFSRLCERHYPALVAIAYSRLAERHLAQDAAQETLLAAYRGIRKLKQPEQFAGWVTGEPFGYTAWLSVEPSGPGEDRLHYMGRDGSPDAGWNDQPDSHDWGPMSYLVEYDPVTFEAEQATAVAAGRTEAALAGYSGDGYVLFKGRADGLLWIIRPGMAEEKAIVLHYSNGTPQDLHVKVTVNGTVVEPNLACPPTGAWDAWGSAAINARFTAGQNTIEIRNLADDAGPAIDKITVFGDNTNLAMNRPIACSAELPGYPASRAVDADSRTSWRLGDLPQWLEVDLGDVYPVYRTQVIGLQNQACRFTVEVKARAEDAYVQVVDRTDNSTAGTAMEPLVDTFEPAAARYVRLTVTGYNGRRSPDIVEFRISAATAK